MKISEQQTQVPYNPANEILKGAASLIGGSIVGTAAGAIFADKIYQDCLIEKGGCMDVVPLVGIGAIFWGATIGAVSAVTMAIFIAQRNNPTTVPTTAIKA